MQEKLFSSKNRTEASLGKKLKLDVLPEVEKVLKVNFYFLRKHWLYIAVFGVFFLVYTGSDVEWDNIQLMVETGILQGEGVDCIELKKTSWFLFFFLFTSVSNQ